MTTKFAFIYICFSPRDGAEYATKLAEALASEGINVWYHQPDKDTSGFTTKIEGAINAATHVIAIITQDLKRPDNFMRSELAFAQAQKKPIIPLMFPNGHRPITILNTAYIPFANWEEGFDTLMSRLRNSDLSAPRESTLRESEVAYLLSIVQRYEQWFHLYTPSPAFVHPKSRAPYFSSALIPKELFPDLDVPFKSTEDVVQQYEDVREAIRKYQRVVLTGDAGSGKTVTLQQLALDYAREALHDETKPLPLVVSLGRLTDGDQFSDFLAREFGGLPLQNYLSDRVILLIDGLSEMPHIHFTSLVEWITHYAKIPVIVTCLRLDYALLQLPLQRIEIASLDVHRIHAYISNYLEDDSADEFFWGLTGYRVRRAWKWYHAKMPSATYAEFFLASDQPGKPWEPDRKVLDESRRNLRDDNLLPDMLKLASSPFLLQIMLEIYVQSGEPVHNPGKIIEVIVRVLLENIRNTTISDSISTVEKRATLQAIAYWAYSSWMNTNMQRETVIQIIKRSVPNQNPEKLLQVLIGHGILETGNSGSEVRFRLQSFQDYFASFELKESIEQGSSAAEYFPFEQWWMSNQWNQVVLILAGVSGDCTFLVEWLAETQPDLAFQVINESGAVCDSRAVQRLFQPASGAHRSTYALAEYGRSVAATDSRSGVGIENRGLPDIEWCTVDAGEFPMGLVGSSDFHHTEMKHTYLIAKFPITYSQFQTFVDAPDGFLNPRWWIGMGRYIRQEIPGQFQRYANHPRDSVTWYQAVAFTNWLNYRYHKLKLLDDTTQIRLPLEVEWEYAARGGDGRTYPWGDDYRVGFANIDEQETSDGLYFLNCTTAVGLYVDGISPFGVHDMAGGVWEWCFDDRDNSIAPLESKNVALKVIRGGSFFNSRHYAQCAYRRFLPPQTWDNTVGFRVVASIKIDSTSTKSEVG